MKTKMMKNLGTLALGAWLILTGLVGLLHLSFVGLSTLMALIALLAGILLVTGR